MHLKERKKVGKRNVANEKRDPRAKRDEEARAPRNEKGETADSRDWIRKQVGRGGLERRRRRRFPKTKKKEEEAGWLATREKREDG